MFNVLAILTMLFLVWSAFVLQILLRNIFEMPEITLDLSSLTSGNHGPFEIEKILITTDDGRKLSALKICDENIPPKKWILFLPEMSATCETWEKYLYFLPREGWGILALDFPGWGESTPYPSHKVSKFLTDIELADAQIALNKTIELSKRTDSIAVFGVSRGAVAALVLGQKHDTVGKVIADSPFCSVEIIKSHFRRMGKIYAPQSIVSLIPDFFIHGYTRFAFFLAGLLKKCRFIQLSNIVYKGVNCPVLLISGLKDKLATPDHIRKLEKNSPKKWEHLEIQDAKHNAAVLTAPELYSKKVLEFLKD